MLCLTQTDTIDIQGRDASLRRKGFPASGPRHDQTHSVAMTLASLMSLPIILILGAVT
jgi:hypothetical protein